MPIGLHIQKIGYYDPDSSNIWPNTIYVLARFSLPHIQHYLYGHSIFGRTTHEMLPCRICICMDTFTHPWQFSHEPKLITVITVCEPGKSNNFPIINYIWSANGVWSVIVLRSPSSVCDRYLWVRVFGIPIRSYIEWNDETISTHARVMVVILSFIIIIRRWSWHCFA